MQCGRWWSACWRLLAPGGSGKGGVVWHTQGAGKSLEMTCLAGKLMTHPQMKNPTLVVVTDRNDLDGQLHGMFDMAAEVLGEKPVQAESRTALREHAESAAIGRHHLHDHPEVCARRG
jgi:type I site-specific restriction-modification system R (restriction) subunit